MTNIIKVEQVRQSIMSLRGQDVILASDVAKLYGVETKAVNQAVKNNPDKFPNGFVFELTYEEWNAIRSKIFTLEGVSGKGKHPKYLPKAFTERGLYMLATILKSSVATQTTLAIVNTFAEVRELRHRLIEIHDTESDAAKHVGMKRIGDILADLIMPELETTETQSSLEFNFVIGKLKHSVTRQRIADNNNIVLKEKVTFARRLLSRGFTDDEVLELVDLSKEDLIKLQKMGSSGRV